MTEQGKTRVWRLDDMRPAKEPERAPQPNLAQTIVGNFGVRDDGSSQRRIEAQRVVVIQPNTLTTRFEREQPQDQAKSPRARHTAEAWAAGANVGAKTELRRNDPEVAQAIAEAQARRAREQASSIVIPRMPAAAKLVLLKERLSKQPKERVLIGAAMIVALALLPLLSGNADDENLVAPAPLSAAATRLPADEAEAASQPPPSAAAANPVRTNDADSVRGTPLSEAERARATDESTARPAPLTAAAHPAGANDANVARAAPLTAAAHPADANLANVARAAPLTAAAHPAGANDANAVGPGPLAAESTITPRVAVDALISGDPALAAARYSALARSHPERPEYAAAARILHEAVERAALSGE